MKLLLIAATVTSVVPLVLSLFIPDWYLGDQQNAVEAADSRCGRPLAPVNRIEREEAGERAVVEREPEKNEATQVGRE